MKEAELSGLKNIMTEYVAHFKENPHSLLAKIYGMFTIERRLMASVTVMLMENTLQIGNPDELLATFDLKGSTHGRKSKGEVTPKTIQKDLDFEAYQ